MELPLGGPALRHYTQSRPRPHRQKLNYRPSRPQETIIESENEVLELMGRVDEGVEEFFTKKVLPTETQNKQDEETITPHEVAPASSVPCPPPTKTLRRKLGDFFTLKKKRGLKSEPSQEGRPKKASIADLIRPLREVARSEKDKEKDRVKEHDKENEKEKAKPRPSAVPGEPAVQEPPVTGDAPLRGEAVPPRRALREGKSQSLILLSGSSSAAGTTNARNTTKKPLEGQHSFEQKLHLMLQRIGVSKSQPGDTQNEEKEMKKAESEGIIIDSKPEPPSTFSKPRTMSASSDTRHQIRVSVSAHEAAGKPALPPKPVLKPAPPPTTSGRNTPENELAQIQEAETSTPAKLSPTTAPPAPDLTAATTSTVPTISDSVPDAAIVTVSPSSTVDTEICTTEAATTPADDAVSENKASVPRSTETSIEPPTSTFPTSTEPPTTSSESITPTSETKTPSSVATMETVSDPSKQSPVSTTSTGLSVKATSPELNEALTAAAAPDPEGDADVSVTNTSDSGSRSILTGPEAVASSISETPVPKTTCRPSISGYTITATVSHEEVPVPMSPTVVPTALPPVTSASTTSETTPTSCDPISSVSALSSIQAALLSPDEIPAPATSSSDTNPTDTPSTATSFKHAGTTSTSSPAISAAISSSTASDPVSKITPNGNESGAASHLLTSPPPSNGGPCQDNDLQTFCEEEAKVEKEEKPAKEDVAEDEELEMITKSKSAEPDEKKETVLREMKSENDKPALDMSDLPRIETQKERAKAEEDTVSEPGKEGERSRDDVVSEPQEQEETLPVGEK